MILIPEAREAFFPFLIASLIVGLLLGALYDVFRIRRVAFRPTEASKISKTMKASGETSDKRRLLSLSSDTVLCFFEDIVFFLVSSLTLILVAFCLHYGLPRGYSLAAALGGFFLYRVTIGRLVMASAEAIVKGLRRFFSFLNRRLLRPIGKGLGRLWSTCEGRVARRMNERRLKRWERLTASSLITLLFSEKRDREGGSLADGYTPTAHKREDSRK